MLPFAIWCVEGFRQESESLVERTVVLVVCEVVVGKLVVQSIFVVFGRLELLVVIMTYFVSVEKIRFGMELLLKLLFKVLALYSNQFLFLVPGQLIVCLEHNLAKAFAANNIVQESEHFLLIQFNIDTNGMSLWCSLACKRV